MQVAIIEDDSNKRQQLRELTCLILPQAEILEAKSFSSGRELIITHRPSIVLLDMSMPMFDVTHKDKGYKPLGFAGRDIMDEITRFRIPSSIIVVTQFDVFGTGKEKKTLKELSDELEMAFPRCYRGTVYYHPAMSGWKTSLTEMVQRLSNEGETK
jgi:hypothetical protein